MDSTKVLSLLERLDDEIDDLEEAIAPLLKTPLSNFASKLPLLDKAKLCVLVTYAIESMLFSYLRLHGVKAREHPVFTELTRVKQYFHKLKVAENPINDGAGKRTNIALDKAAAQRFITAGLSGNDKWDLELAEQKAKERAKAHIKFTELSEKMKQDELSRKRKADSEGEERSGISDSDSNSATPEEGAYLEAPETIVSKKKRRKSGKNKSLDISGPSSAVSSPAQESQKKGKREKKNKKNKIQKPKE